MDCINTILEDYIENYYSMNHPGEKIIDDDELRPIANQYLVSSFMKTTLERVLNDVGRNNSFNSLAKRRQTTLDYIPERIKQRLITEYLEDSVLSGYWIHAERLVSDLGIRSILGTEKIKDSINTSIESLIAGRNKLMAKEVMSFPVLARNQKNVNKTPCKAKDINTSTALFL